MAGCLLAHDHMRRVLGKRDSPGQPQRASWERVPRQKTPARCHLWVDCGLSFLQLPRASPLRPQMSCVVHEGIAGRLGESSQKGAANLPVWHHGKQGSPAHLTPTSCFAGS